MELILVVTLEAALKEVATAPVEDRRACLSTLLKVYSLLLVSFVLLLLLYYDMYIYIYIYIHTYIYIIVIDIVTIEVTENAEKNPAEVKFRRIKMSNAASRRRYTLC